MTLSMSKKKLIAAIVLAALAIGILWIRSLGAPDSAPVYTISTSVEITASPDAVWSLLADFSQYAQWNPYLSNIEGEFKVGETLTVTLIDANFEGPLVVKPRMASIEPGKSFAWRGTLLMQGLMDTHHVFEITGTADGNTRIHQYEEFRGMIAHEMADLTGRHAKTQQAFETMHAAIAAELSN